MRQHFLVLALISAGCGGGEILNKSVSNAGNLFTFSAEFKGGYSGLDNETWTPSTQQAWVTWTGTSLTSGEVQLQIYDATGNTVAGVTVSPASVPPGQPTDPGTPGAWRLSFTFSSLTGMVAMNVQGST
jgi:hypothetical protein